MGGKAVREGRRGGLRTAAVGEKTDVREGRELASKTENTAKGWKHGTKKRTDSTWGE